MSEGDGKLSRPNWPPLQNQGPGAKSVGRRLQIPRVSNPAATIDGSTFWSAASMAGQRGMGVDRIRRQQMMESTVERCEPGDDEGKNLFECWDDDVFLETAHEKKQKLQADGDLQFRAERALPQDQGLVGSKSFGDARTPDVVLSPSSGVGRKRAELEREIEEFRERSLQEMIEEQNRTQKGDQWGQRKRTVNFRVDDNSELQRSNSGDFHLRQVMQGREQGRTLPRRISLSEIGLPPELKLQCNYLNVDASAARPQQVNLIDYANAERQGNVIPMNVGNSPRRRSIEIQQNMQRPMGIHQQGVEIGARIEDSNETPERQIADLLGTTVSDSQIQAPVNMVNSQPVRNVNVQNRKSRRRSSSENDYQSQTSGRLRYPREVIQAIEPQKFGKSCEPGEWEDFQEAIENYLYALGLEDDHMKILVLNNFVEGNARVTLRRLKKDFVGISFVDLLEKMSQIFVRKIEPTIAAHRMRHMKKQAHESYLTFATKLKEIVYDAYASRSYEIRQEMAADIFLENVPEAWYREICRRATRRDLQCYLDVAIILEQQDMALAEIKRTRRGIENTQNIDQKSGSKWDESQEGRNQRNQSQDIRRSPNRLSIREPQSSSRQEQRVNMTVQSRRCWICDSPEHLKYNCDRRSKQQEAKDDVKRSADSNKVLGIASEESVSPAACCHRSEGTVSQQMGVEEIQQLRNQFIRVIQGEKSEKVKEPKKAIPMGRAVRCDIEVESIPVSAMVDTGAVASVMTFDLLVRIAEAKGLDYVLKRRAAFTGDLYSYDYKKLKNMHYSVTLNITVGGVTRSVPVLVDTTKMPQNCQFLMGVPMLRDFGFRLIDFNGGIISFEDVEISGEKAVLRCVKRAPAIREISLMLPLATSHGEMGLQEILEAPTTTEPLCEIVPAQEAPQEQMSRGEDEELKGVREGRNEELLVVANRVEEGEVNVESVVMVKEDDENLQQKLTKLEAKQKLLQIELKIERTKRLNAEQKQMELAERCRLMYLGRSDDGCSGRKYPAKLIHGWEPPMFREMAKLEKWKEFQTAMEEYLKMLEVDEDHVKLRILGRYLQGTPRKLFWKYQKDSVCASFAEIMEKLNIKCDHYRSIILPSMSVVNEEQRVGVGLLVASEVVVVPGEEMWNENPRRVEQEMGYVKGIPESVQQLSFSDLNRMSELVQFKQQQGVVKEEPEESPGVKQQDPMSAGEDRGKRSQPSGTVPQQPGGSQVNPSKGEKSVKEQVGWTIGRKRSESKGVEKRKHSPDQREHQSRREHTPERHRKRSKEDDVRWERKQDQYKKQQVTHGEDIPSGAGKGDKRVVVYRSPKRVKRSHGTEVERSRSRSPVHPSIRRGIQLREARRKLQEWVERTDKDEGERLLFTRNLQVGDLEWKKIELNTRMQRQEYWTPNIKEEIRFESSDRGRETDADLVHKQEYIVMNMLHTGYHPMHLPFVEVVDSSSLLEEAIEQLEQTPSDDQGRKWFALEWERYQPHVPVAAYAREIHKFEAEREQRQKDEDEDVVLARTMEDIVSRLESHPEEREWPEGCENKTFGYKDLSEKQKRQYGLKPCIQNNKDTGSWVATLQITAFFRYTTYIIQLNTVCTEAMQGSIEISSLPSELYEFLTANAHVFVVFDRQRCAEGLQKTFGMRLTANQDHQEITSIDLQEVAESLKIITFGKRLWNMKRLLNWVFLGDVEEKVEDRRMLGWIDDVMAPIYGGETTVDHSAAIVQKLSPKIKRRLAREAQFVVFIMGGMLMTHSRRVIEDVSRTLKNDLGALRKLFQLCFRSSVIAAPPVRVPQELKAAMGNAKIKANEVAVMMEGVRLGLAEDAEEVEAFNFWTTGWEVVFTYMTEFSGHLLGIEMISTQDKYRCLSIFAHMMVNCWRSIREPDREIYEFAAKMRQVPSGEEQLQQSEERKIPPPHQQEVAQNLVALMELVRKRSSSAAGRPSIPPATAPELVVNAKGTAFDLKEELEVDIQQQEQFPEMQQIPALEQLTGVNKLGFIKRPGEYSATRVPRMWTAIRKPGYPPLFKKVGRVVHSVRKQRKMVEKQWKREWGRRYQWVNPRLNKCAYSAPPSEFICAEAQELQLPGPSDGVKWSISGLNEGRSEETPEDEFEEQLKFYGKGRGTMGRYVRRF